MDSSYYRSRAYTDLHTVSQIRVAVLGSPYVGKTTLVNQILHDRLTDEIRQTISDTHNIFEDKVKLEILDTGDFYHSVMKKMAIRNSHAFILVYAINDERSFEHVGALRNDIVLRKGEDVPIVVVGTKCHDGSRQVDSVIADCVVTMDWECPYFEVSANDQYEACGVFDYLFRCPSINSLCTTMGCSPLIQAKGRAMSLPLKTIVDCKNITLPIRNKKRHLSFSLSWKGFKNAFRKKRRVSYHKEIEYV